MLFLIYSSSSSDDDDDGSSTSENQDAQSERSHESANTRLHSSLTASLNHRTTLTPNHSKSLSTPHTGQNIPVHPVMKSNSNPAVDKQAMGITSGRILFVLKSFLLLLDCVTCYLIAITLLHLLGILSQLHGVIKM